ncbi:MAG: extracellular solute-binding protein [Sphaerochaeta sp.]|nr:extracellular solute-binding protein [Sphaerochaeta sp.]
MKKLLTVSLIVLITMSTIFAQGTSEKEVKKSLTIWVEKSFSNDANYLMEKRIEAYGKEKGVKVSAEFISAIDFMTKLNAAIEAGNTPDVVSANFYKVLSYGSNNPFMDVSDLMEEINDYRTFLNSTYQGTKIEGKNYYIPFNASSDLLFLRKDIFDAKGVAIPTTWDELFDAAIAVSDPDNGVYGFGMGSGPTDEDGCNTFRMINWSNGGALLDEKGNIIANKDSETLRLLTNYKRMYDAGAIPPASVAWNPGGNNASYLMGESAMVMNAPTLYNAMKNDSGYADLLANTLIMPPPVGKVDHTVLGLVYGWAVMNKSKNADVAKDYIKYSLETEWYNEYIALVAPVFVPVFEDGLKNPLFTTGVNKAAMDYAANATGYYGYPVKNLDGLVLASRHYYQFPICALMNNVVAKNKTPQKALDFLAIDMKRVADTL